MTKHAIVFFLIFSPLWLHSAYGQETDNSIHLKGTVKDNFREVLDSVRMYVDDNFKTDSFLLRHGKIDCILQSNSTELNIRFSKNSFRQENLRLSVSENNTTDEVHIILYPDFNILIHGRVRNGSIPVEDVHIIAKHNVQVYNQNTLGCYEDNEGYWNCLYHGMFKMNIPVENPDDSITLFFNKSGYKPYRKQMQFSDYDGSIMEIKLHYADEIPNLSPNNFNLKVAPPADVFYPSAKYKGWYINLSYFRTLSEKFSRIVPGIEAAMSTDEYRSVAEHLPDADSTAFDSTFINYSLAPALLLWITKPECKKLGTYLGTAFHYSFATQQFNLQPFLGTRYFLDLQKSLSLELWYLNQEIEKTAFDPSNTIIPVKKNFREHTEKWIINIGLQVTF